MSKNELRKRPSSQGEEGLQDKNTNLLAFTTQKIKGLKDVKEGDTQNLVWD